MKKNLQYQKSFTLIELMVVVAIIGLLSSIVMVNLRGPREKARITKSLEFSQSVQHAIGNEAVGIWNFDEGSGTLANDISGYANNGTIINGALYTDETPNKAVGLGQGKYALNFDGVNDYVSLPGNTNTSLQNNINTVSMWAYIRSVGPNSYAELYSVIGGNRTGIKWQTNSIGVDANGDFYNYRVSASLTFNTWNHIVVEIDRTNNIAKVYVNAVYKGQTNVWPSYTPTANTPRIASNSLTGNLGDYLNGIIDEVRIYSTALSLSEIQKHYLAGSEKHQQLTRN